VSYIDPTLDRCAAVHEWMSCSDMYRSSKSTLAFNDSSAQHALENMYVPPAAGAIHVLCRVEQLPDLIFSARELIDFRYQCEENSGLLQKFVEGLSLHNGGGSKCIQQVASELIPYALYILSAGEGSSALTRSVTSVEILSKMERASFEQHVAVLRALGLTYVREDNKFVGTNGVSSMILEPPIHRFSHFSDLVITNSDINKHEIPSTVRNDLKYLFLPFLLFQLTSLFLSADERTTCGTGEPCTSYVGK
jgi:chromosome transmission fidelity protein 18